MADVLVWQDILGTYHWADGYGNEWTGLEWDESATLVLARDGSFVYTWCYDEDDWSQSGGQRSDEITRRGRWSLRSDEAKNREALYNEILSTARKCMRLLLLNKNSDTLPAAKNIANLAAMVVQRTG
eukprot:SAG31_NODE_7157_length_1771_cov_2.869019_3_plen_126_part_01